jgi:two-component system response regulator RegA
LRERWCCVGPWHVITGSRACVSPLARVEWEHIQQALSETQGNISAAARLLGMHRRSLQRKLAERPGPERKPGEEGGK